MFKKIIISLALSMFGLSVNAMPEKGSIAEFKVNNLNLAATQKVSKCNSGGGINPVDKIDKAFLETLLQEALDFHEELKEINPKTGKLEQMTAYNSRTVAVGQVKDITGKRLMVVATSTGSFSSGQVTLAQQRQYTRVMDRTTGYHAEGRLIQWAFTNNYTVEAMGVSRNLCPDCKEDIQLNSIKNRNLVYGDEYFTNNPKKQPKLRPARPAKC